MALAFHEPNGRIAQVAGQFSGKCTELVAAGPVSRILSAARMLRDDHSSGTRIAARLKRPTRRFNAPSRYVRSLVQKNQAALPSYLVLLRVGFALPAALLPRRCALTAPFHPYPYLRRRTGGLFSVALSVERSQLCKPGGPPGRYPAHCSAEFGLSSRQGGRPSGPAANWFIINVVTASSSLVFD